MWMEGRDMSETVKLPLIPLRGLTVFPNMVIHFDVGREKSGKVRVRQQGKYVKPDTWQAGKRESGKAGMRECGNAECGMRDACWRVGVLACGVWHVACGMCGDVAGLPMFFSGLRRCRRIARFVAGTGVFLYRCREQGAGSRVRGCEGAAKMPV